MITEVSSSLNDRNMTRVSTSQFGVMTKTKFFAFFLSKFEKTWFLVKKFAHEQNG